MTFLDPVQSVHPIPPNMRTWAEIDLGAIRHNLDVVRSLIGPDPGILAVVKANAYGHGIAEVAPAIADLVELFGVANVEEATALAALVLGRDILILSPSLPAEREEAVRSGFIVSVSGPSEAAAFAAFGPTRINYKIDTGMGRMGALPEAAQQDLEQMAHLAAVEVHSISTHLPSPDDDPVFTRNQLAEFSALAAVCRRIVPTAKVHALNSTGILRFPDHAFDIVRAGLMLYGSAYPRELEEPLRPALTWKTRITLVREVPAGHGISYGRTFITPRPLRVASLAVGYADGFPRQASGHGAQVLIGGRRCPVLGRVTMDQILADVSEVPFAKEGDEAVLVGGQGCEEIRARELAERASTISWDIFTGIKARVKRFVV